MFRRFFRHDFHAVLDIDRPKVHDDTVANDTNFHVRKGVFCVSKPLTV